VIVSSQFLEGNAMKSGNIAFATGALICALSASTDAQSSKDWVDVKDPKELRAIYSDKTFRGKDGSGTPFVAHYRSDGKGIMVSRDQRIPRTWEVKGKDQVCITSTETTNCYRLQRNKKNRNEIAARNVKDHWLLQFTVEDGIPQF
jgi:hypothetical protein